MASPVPIPFIKTREARSLQDSNQILINLLDDQFKKTYASYSVISSQTTTHRAFSKAAYTVSQEEIFTYRLLDLLKNPINLSETQLSTYQIFDRNLINRSLTTAFTGEYKFGRELSLGLDLIDEIIYTARTRDATQPLTLINLDYQQIHLDLRDSVGNYEQSAEDTYSAFNQELLAIAEHKQSNAELLAELEAEADQIYQGDELLADGTPMTEQDFNDYQSELNGMIDSLKAEQTALDNYASELNTLVQAGKRSRARAADPRRGGSRSAGGAGSAGLAGLLDMGGGDFSSLDSGEGGGGGGGGGDTNASFAAYFDEYMSDFQNSFIEYNNASATTNAKFPSFQKKQPGGARTSRSRSAKAKRAGTGFKLGTARDNSQQATDDFLQDVASYYSVREINVIKYSLLGGYVLSEVWQINHGIFTAHNLLDTWDITQEVISYPNTIYNGSWVADQGSYEVLERDGVAYAIDTGKTDDSYQFLARDTTDHLLNIGNGISSYEVLDRDTVAYQLNGSDSGSYETLERDTAAYDVTGIGIAGEYQVYVREVVTQELINADQGEHSTANRFTYNATLADIASFNYSVVGRDTTTYTLESSGTVDYNLVDRDTADHLLITSTPLSYEVLDRDTANHQSDDVAIAAGYELLERDTTAHSLEVINDNVTELYVRDIIEYSLSVADQIDTPLYTREEISRDGNQVSSGEYALIARDTSDRSLVVASLTTYDLLARDTANHESSVVVEIGRDFYYSNHELVEKGQITIDLVDHVSTIPSERERWLMEHRIVSDRGVWLGRN